MAEKDVHYNLSFYIYNVNVTKQKIGFQVAAPKVNNTMVHLMGRNAFWIMVTLCIGRVALWQKVILFWKLNKEVHVSKSYDGS